MGEYGIGALYRLSELLRPALNCGPIQGNRRAPSYNLPSAPKGPTSLRNLDDLAFLPFERSGNLHRGLFSLTAHYERERR